MVSPIADNAFNYYKFKLESTFYDDRNQLINKILVTPKRDKEPVLKVTFILLKILGQYMELTLTSKDIACNNRY